MIILFAEVPIVLFSSFVLFPCEHISFVLPSCIDELFTRRVIEILLHSGGFFKCSQQHS